ncbi:FAD-binding oxidoreductase [Hoeflea ulvae]|uniref:FAD-binding oxidoreductase n=1 Tax=Hoeflea ulvae TaxID=2983764 RepID=A0ABT3YCW7_9HYPH|nr:FAD-binding oxidoreductase [Hoeflea ulvae]MCY0093730.1 FAD-binding oxidoreductase [Hoeflea ulvae]
MSEARKIAETAIADVVNDLRGIVGAAHVFTGASDMSAYLTDWTKHYFGMAIAVVRPADVQQVSAIVKLCGAAGIAIVPQGGNTGLAGGGVPSAARPSIVLSLSRMTTIRELHEAGRTVVAEAGVVLEILKDHASAHGLLFPLSFGAKGSCTIGGNLATNAGGSNVVRYGNTGELCLGIEAVLPDGSIFNGLTGLRKDNTGYDLKDLLIGAEGTLGIITAAVFKLSPQPLTQVTAFLSMASVDAALHALNLIQDRTGQSVEAFEYLPQPVLSAIGKAFPALKSPLQGPVETGVLLEVGSSRVSDARTDEAGANHLTSELLILFEELMESGDMIDAVVAQSEQQRADLWHMRESVLESIMAYGPSYHFDISLPLARISGFLEAMDASAAALGFETLTIGHLGDGNLHYALVSQDQDTWNALPLEEAKARAFDLLKQLNGSFSAEHGIGQSKLDVMRALKEPAQLDAMRAIKRALDPQDIMNPGRLIPTAE